jgi:S1-C subfamily serine protease
MNTALRPIVGFGTAFFVNQSGDFVTAAHVVVEGRRFIAEHGNCVLTIYLPVGGWHQSQGFTVREYTFTNCDMDEVVDVALCRATPNPFYDHSVSAAIAPVSFDVAPQVDGTAVAFTGFPLSNAQPITAKGFVAALEFHGTVPHRVVVDRGAWPGASGSPLYRDDGRVVGIVTETGTGFANGLSYARSSAEIVTFLRDHGELRGASFTDPPDGSMLASSRLLGY